MTGLEGLVDGRYAIERELGSGGMGIVYLAHDVWLRRPVALKLVTPPDVDALGPESGTDRAAAALGREAEVLASVRSPHVVELYGFGAHGRRSYLAMEYLSGRTLADVVAEHRIHGADVPLRRALAILSSVARGLDAVHAKGLAHRDVKPANIVIEDGSGRPVLLDFGLAGSGDAWDPALAAGTPQYMAPELSGMTGAPVGPPADVYSLACTAFAVLGGRPPYEGSSRLEIILKHIGAPTPRLAALRPELAPLDVVLGRALAKEPERRYPTCGAFADALAAAAAGLGAEELVARVEAVADRAGLRAANDAYAGDA